MTEETPTPLEQLIKNELEQHHNSIRNLNRLIDNAERKLEDLKRKETLEKYKPQLEGYVDKYIDNKIIPYPLDLTKNLMTVRTRHKNFNEILEYFKMLKEKGNLIYVYKIGEPTLIIDDYSLAVIYFKPENNER